MQSGKNKLIFDILATSVWHLSMSLFFESPLDIHVASNSNSAHDILMIHSKYLMQGNMLNSPEIVDEDKVTADAALDLPEFCHKLFEC